MGAAQPCPRGAALGRGRAKWRREVQGCSERGWTSVSGPRPQGASLSSAGLLLHRVDDHRPTSGGVLPVWTSL